MGGSLTKHINKKITEICIETISKTVSNENIVVDASINLEIKTTKPVNIIGNEIVNNITIDTKAFLTALSSSDIGNKIADNIKHNSELIDEGLVSVLSSNKSEVLNELINQINNRIEFLTQSNFTMEIKNRLNLIVETNDIVTISGNSLKNTIEIFSSTIINTTNISKSISDLSSELSSTSSITVKNALAILVDSLTGLISAPLLAILGILITCAVLFLLFNKSIKDFLFGWMTKKKK